MVDVRLENISKRFQTVFAADNITLRVAEGQFFTLLGPSGCGKTTTLRIIAGFTRQDEGNVYFGERLMNDVPPHRRNAGMVFQTYALWPHMKVFDNIVFGLNFRKVGKNEKEQRVREMLKLVGLEGLEDRLPSQLSGGQQQRVALARALVIEPQVLLLDEPLSNLDAKLRVQMRTEIKRLQKRLDITTIYVTHDQEEALSVSDEIAVQNKGSIQQIGTPREIYEDPLNSFVAGFIGLANFFSGQISDVDEKTLSATIDTEESGEIKAKLETYEDWSRGLKVVLSVRPEAITVYKRGSTPTGMNRVNAMVSLTSYLGNLVRYELETGGGTKIRADVYNPRHRYIFKEGEEVSIGFNSEDVKPIKLV